MRRQRRLYGIRLVLKCLLAGKCGFPIIPCVPVVDAHWAVVAVELLVSNTAGFARGTTLPCLYFYYI